MNVQGRIDGVDLEAEEGFDDTAEKLEEIQKELELKYLKEVKSI